MKFDVIGDVHGEHGKLVDLLKLLEYRERDGVWQHCNRKAVFVGDLIDRGPHQMATLNLVRRMVDARAAHCILGNHEFNAISWFTPDLRAPGQYLREHGKPGNRVQHAAFLAEIEGRIEHAQIITWFKTLPLWLDLGGIRVVHACWHEESMELLRPMLQPDHTLTDETIQLANRKGEAAFEAIEILCKGPEVLLPEGVSFQDKEGKIRYEVRIQWWNQKLSTYRKAAIGPIGDIDTIPDVPMPSMRHKFTYEGVPVIFGHYWFKGRPQVISERFACIDFSVAKGGPLVAYRWDGETELSNGKLRWVE